MENSYRFIMISAMYENGGNTTQRLLDGHPDLMVYPFESQPGTKYALDYLSSIYPLKYRWPVIPSGLSAEEVYETIIDEEAKIRLKTSHVSKFRDSPMSLSDSERKQLFARNLVDRNMTRANIMESFFRSTFDAWKDFNRSGKERFHVGYSPIIGIDGDKIIEDYNGNGHVLHVVRNPWSAFADTLKRAVPLSLRHYIFGWVTCQYYARIFADKYPNHFHIVRYEDIIQDSEKVLGSVLQKMGSYSDPALRSPSWNGKKLEQVYPWGTIRIPTEQVNLATARELKVEQINEIKSLADLYIKAFNYESLWEKIKS
jgi:hypothetical protein